MFLYYFVRALEESLAAAARGDGVLQTFATDELPSADRFDAFREQLAMLHAPMDLVSDHAADYTARTWLLALGATLVYGISGLPVLLRRSPRLIRQTDRGTYNLTLMLRGSGGSATA